MCLGYAKNKRHREESGPSPSRYVRLKHYSISRALSVVRLALNQYRIASETEI